MHFLVSVIDDKNGAATLAEMAAIDAFNERLQANGLLPAGPEGRNGIVRGRPAGSHGAVPGAGSDRMNFPMMFKFR